MIAIVKRDNIKNEIIVIDDIDLDNCIVEIEDPIIEDTITEDPIEEVVAIVKETVVKENIPIEKVIIKSKELSTDEIKNQIANRIYNFK